MLMTGWFVKMCENRAQRWMRRPRLRRQQRMACWAAAECLETRALLSAVGVTSQAGVITLTGGTGNNTINASVVNGNLELTGSNGTTFTFNGTTASTVDVPINGQLNGLKLNLGTGNNTLNLDGTGLATIHGSVVVTAGNGNDSVNLSNITTTGAISVTAGSGTDSVVLSGDTAASVAVQAGNGSDVIAVTNTTITGNTNTSLGSQLPGLLGSSLGCTSNLSHLLGNLGGLLHVGVTAQNGLSITTGGGNDVVALSNVTQTNTGLGQTWGINLGGGHDTVTLDSVRDANGLSIRQSGGTLSTTDSVSITNSTIGGNTNIALAGTDNVNLTSDTFTGPVSVTTGLGSGSTIDVNDSTFSSLASFTAQGRNATVNLETGGISGSGTVFQGPLFVTFGGSGGVANLGSSSVNDSLTINGFSMVIGGYPGATVNITGMGTNTIFNGPSLIPILATVNQL